MIYLLFLSIIFNIFFNFHIINGSIHFIAATIIVYLQFLILSLSKNIFTIFFPVVLFLTSIASYFIKNFHILITTNSIGLIFETSLEEASGFIGKDFIFYTGIILFFSIIAVIIFRKFVIISKKKTIIIILLLSSLLPILKKKHYTSQLLPHIIFEKTYKFALEKYKFSKLIANRKELKLKYLKFDKNAPLIVVMVIGEAARADHFHINGYYRQTSPELEKKKNIISFKNFYSCDITTRKSIPCLMTRATLKNRKPAKYEKSVISVFKKAKFYTYWISNQRKLGKYDSPVTVIAKEADYIKFNNTIGDLKHIHIYDENLIPELKKIVSDKSKKFKFIVLHTIGSHWHYEKHYPDKFRKFKPVCTQKNPSKCGREKVINSYDNTILNTDFVLSKFIDILSNKRALLFYASDHGEDLGENGIYGHGQVRDKNQTHIAAFLWFSKKLLKEKKYREYYIHAKEKEKNKLSHDYIFHSLLGCTGIKCDIIDKKLNLCK